MPLFRVGDLSLHYEVHGDDAAPPVLLLAPGGMRSSIARWAPAPYNPLVSLSEHRRIAMDQRNAGQSRASVRATDGWPTYTRDQLALLDHLGIDRFDVVGMCIGCSFIAGLLRAVPDRVRSAVLIQPIGEDQNRGMFYDLFDDWRASIASDHPEADEHAWSTFRTAMYGGDFVFCGTRDELRTFETPILVLMGNDAYHPAAISREIASLAPHARLVERWKEPELLAETDRTVRAFLAVQE